jgi:hypothetical protein
MDVYRNAVQTQDNVTQIAMTWDSLAAAAKKRAAIADSLGQVLGNPQHFYLEAVKGPYDGAATVMATLARRGVGKDTAGMPIAAERLHFGHPIFSVGVGIAYSDLPSHTFKAVKQFAPRVGGTTGDTVVNVVAFDNSSPYHLGPMVVLDANPWGPRRPHQLLLGLFDNFAFELGGTISQQHAPLPELYAGVALSAVHGWIRFGIGTYAGQESVLPKGFAIGSVLPDSTVPTRTRFAVRTPAVMISMKVLPQ